MACESLTPPEGETIGEFEFTTALAFLFFAEQECDIVVLETGLGGRCDATNVIKSAEVQRYYADFARPYGGARQHNGGSIAPRRQVFSPGTAVVCADGQPNDVQRVLRRACDAAGAVWFGGAEDCRVLRCDISGSAFVYEGQATPLPCPGAISCRMRGRLCGRWNELRERGWNILISRRRGLAGAYRRPAGTRRSAAHPCLTAHTMPQARDALCHAVDELLKMKRLHRCDGHESDKDYETVFHEVAGLRGRLYAPVRRMRVSDAGCTHDCRAGAAVVQERTSESAEHAIELALEHAKMNDCILIWWFAVPSVSARRF